MHNLQEEIRTRLIYAGGLKNDEPTNEAINSMADLFSSKFSELEREIGNLKELGTYAIYSDERYHQDAYNQALSDILKLFNREK